MNVSKIVKNMSKDEIVKALKGYKDGTYGGDMKGVMAGQVKNLSDADIEAIATQIAGGEEKSASAEAANAAVDAAKEKAADMAKDAADKAVDTAVEKAKEKATDAAMKMAK
jgi:cytochrome c-type protein NapB